MGRTRIAPWYGCGIRPSLTDRNHGGRPRQQRLAGALPYVRNVSHRSSGEDRRTIEQPRERMPTEPYRSIFMQFSRWIVI